MFGINIKQLNPLSGICKREVVTVEFSSNILKFAYTRVSADRIQIVNLKTCNIADLPQEEISKTISASFNGLNVKNPDVINIIPSHLVITKNIEIPSVNPQEIREIINLQAGRHTPYSREEIIVDYIDIGVSKHNYSKILLVIIPRNAVKRQFVIFDKAGLNLKRVFFAPEGLRGLTRTVLNKGNNSPLGVIHIDEGFSDFAVIFNNKPVFIRSIPMGTRHLIEEDRYGVRFSEEVKKSLESYQSENIEKNPNMLILTGATDELKYLETVLNKALNLPVGIISYFKDLSISQEAQRAAEAAKRVSFLNVLSPFLIWEEAKIDLMPEEIKLKKSLEERGRDLIKTGIFILTAFILVFSILTTKIYFRVAYLKSLNTKYESLDNETQELERHFSRLSLIKNYLLNRGYSLEILSELYNLIPTELQLGDIRFDERNKFSIKGIAESMSCVFSFVDKMEKSKYFKDVKTIYTAKRKDGLRDVTDFEITSLMCKE